MYNNWPRFSIYMAMSILVAESIGVQKVNKLNVLKANMLYDFIDNCLIIPTMLTLNTGR